MNEESVKSLTKTDLDAFEVVLGSPSLLTTESVSQYREMFDQLIESLQPNDGLELLLVRQVLQETWKIFRYERHQTLGIDRRFRESTEFQTDLKAERAKKREALSKKLAEKTGRPVTELSQMVELIEVIETSVEDVDAIAERGREHRREIVHNQALEAGIDFQEKLDRLISSATKRRNDALQQLEYYGVGLGRRLRELTDNIIDGDAVEIEKPNVIGRRVGSDTTETGEDWEKNLSSSAAVGKPGISVASSAGGETTDIDPKVECQSTEREKE
jgi:hypothetical protein